MPCTLEWDILFSMKHIIYQVLPRLWGRGKLSEWDSSVFDYLKTLGVDYIWYTGIPRHASGKAFVKGDPGSPYSISDWKDVNPYLADSEENRLSEFRELVARTHSAGLKVLIDCIPNHVARDYSGPICHFDYCDADWTDTLKNDWSRAETGAAMADVLRFWASVGVDGFRCDMVELVPSESLKSLIADVRKDYPDLLFVAEVYGKDNYRTYLDYVGFDLLYDKSGMYDRLRAVSCCGMSARELTWNWQWLGDMQPRMLNFLENHDEQRLASPEFLADATHGYAPLAVSLLFNTSSFMLYFGQEVGADAKEGALGRTSIFEWRRPGEVDDLVNFIRSGRGLSLKEEAVLSRYKSMLEFAVKPAFASGNVWDLCYCNCDSPGFDPDRHFAFLRYDSCEAYLVVCNFSAVDAAITVRIPEELFEVCGCGEKSVCVRPFDAEVVCLK